MYGFTQVTLSGSWYSGTATGALTGKGCATGAGTTAGTAGTGVGAGFSCVHHVPLAHPPEKSPPQNCMVLLLGTFVIVGVGIHPMFLPSGSTSCVLTILLFDRD